DAIGKPRARRARYLQAWRRASVQRRRQRQQRDLADRNRRRRKRSDAGWQRGSASFPPPAAPRWGSPQTRLLALTRDWLVARAHPANGAERHADRDAVAWKTAAAGTTGHAGCGRCFRP